MIDYPKLQSNNKFAIARSLDGYLQVFRRAPLMDIVPNESPSEIGLSILNNRIHEAIFLLLCQKLPNSVLHRNNKIGFDM